jgi:putative transposase
MEVPRTTYRYRSCRDDSELRERLLELARERPRFGYRRLHILLRHDAIKVNRKKVQRVYRELGLTVKRTRRKSGAPANGSSFVVWKAAGARTAVLTAPNQE